MRLCVYDHKLKKSLAIYDNVYRQNDPRGPEGQGAGHLSLDVAFKKKIMTREWSMVLGREIIEINIYCLGIFARAPCNLHPF